MAHRLRACTALSEYPSSVLNTHIWWLKTTFNFSSRGSDSAGVSGNLHSCAHTHITEQGTEKHNILQDMYSGLHNYWWTLNKSVCIRYLVFIDFHDMRSLHPTLKLWYKAFFCQIFCFTEYWLTLFTPKDVWIYMSWIWIPNRRLFSHACETAMWWLENL